MSLYILMTRLTVDQLADPRGRRAAGREWLKHVERACPEVKFIAHYALLGRYDFMDIYEAPNDEIAHKVSLISRSTGAVTAESWPAVAYPRFLKISREVAAEIAKQEE
ncbi:MAG: GYD domain-containing protein [Deltaproteobacteria bacterium]|nr:GYD domain-containing protein [Deltaproteobacteria bacterium]